MTCRAQSREALPSSVLHLRRTKLMQCRTAGKVGTPGDVANLCTFLADPVKASFITGQEFVLDGGVTRKMIYPEWSLSHQALLFSRPVLHRPIAAFTYITGIWYVQLQTTKQWPTPNLFSQWKLCAANYDCNVEDYRYASLERCTIWKFNSLIYKLINAARLGHLCCEQAQMFTCCSACGSAVYSCLAFSARSSNSFSSAFEVSTSFAICIGKEYRQSCEESLLQTNLTQLQPATHCCAIELTQ